MERIWWLCFAILFYPALDYISSFVDLFIPRHSGELMDVAQWVISFSLIMGILAGAAKATTAFIEPLIDSKLKSLEWEIEQLRKQLECTRG
jgi:hypothetical protein